ncbi:hypothetical protein WN51_02232 [Melipona quadrifasciata]|uniref:Uncharacterized protein n=1 Tax=Melipona quadrifasciata TaxID=166423 RepID=A0A0N0U418_9HYME|nr:hypothetical protein WN51_02232 [Melipona quadrifasciata]
MVIQASLYLIKWEQKVSENAHGHLLDWKIYFSSTVIRRVKALVGSYRHRARNSNRFLKNKSSRIESRRRSDTVMLVLGNWYKVLGLWKEKFVPKFLGGTRLRGKMEQDGGGSGLFDGDSDKVSSGPAHSASFPFLPPNVPLQGTACRPGLQQLPELPLRPPLHLRLKEGSKLKFTSKFLGHYGDSASQRSIAIRVTSVQRTLSAGALSGNSTLFRFAIARLAKRLIEMRMYRCNPAEGRKAKKKLWWNFKVEERRMTLEETRQSAAVWLPGSPPVMKPAGDTGEINFCPKNAISERTRLSYGTLRVWESPHDKQLKREEIIYSNYHFPDFERQIGQQNSTEIIILSRSKVFIKEVHPYSRLCTLGNSEKSKMIEIDRFLSTNVYPTHAFVGLLPSDRSVETVFVACHGPSEPAIDLAIPRNVNGSLIKSTKLSKLCQKEVDKSVYRIRRDDTSLSTFRGDSCNKRIPPSKVLKGCMKDEKDAWKDEWNLRKEKERTDRIQPRHVEHSIEVTPRMTLGLDFLCFLLHFSGKACYSPTVELVRFDHSFQPRSTAEYSIPDILSLKVILVGVTQKIGPLQVSRSRTVELNGDSSLASSGNVKFEFDSTLQRFDFSPSSNNNRIESKEFIQSTKIHVGRFSVFQERLSRFLDPVTAVADVRLHLSEQPHEKALRQDLLDEFLPSSTSIDLSGTDSALYPFDPQQESYQEIWLPPTSMYPYFLFPGAARTSYYDHESTYDVQEPGQRRQHGHRHQHGRHQEAPELPGRPGVLVVETYDPRADHENRQEARAGTDDEHRPLYREKDADDLKVISHPDNSTSFEVIESQLENPLIDADHHDLVAMKQIPVPGGHHHKTQHKRNQTDDRNRSTKL